jgi:hypothetical protein
VGVINKKLSLFPGYGAMLGARVERMGHKKVMQRWEIEFTGGNDEQL